MNGGRGVKNEEVSAGGWTFLRTLVAYWDDGIKNLRHYIPTAQQDWGKEDASGTSALSYPFDSGTSRVPVEINPTSTGTHKIRKRIILPRDFGIFHATEAFTLMVRRSGGVTSIKATLYKGGSADGGINGVSISPAASATWELKTLLPTGQYNPGDFVTLEIEYVSSGTSVTVDIADLAISYLTNRGNV